MLILATLLFPLLLMAVTLLMQRVEQPLRDESLGDRVVDVLRAGGDDDVEQLVAGLTKEPLRRYWQQREWWSRMTSAYHIGRG
ncbi:MAG TPA: hypothetical protein VG708_05000 [Mycobacteriales bacterium]|jgi:hypothetical protein|nr:hypothetical protein [Mycobacteriales bacterium]